MIKLLCFIVGWKTRILEECGESSRRMLLKLASALLIMVCLWGTIGYVFAGRYIGIESEFGRMICAAVFAVIIVSVERIIILNVGKNWLMSAARITLAVCMAILGSFIFDQVIFSNDLKIEVDKERREVKIKEVIANKQLAINKEIDQRSTENDSLGRVNERLYGEIAKNPITKVTLRAVKNVQVGTDSVGNPIYERKVDYEQHAHANPKNQEISDNDRTREKNLEKINSLRDELRSVAEQAQDEYLNEKSELYKKPGFMEELNASLKVFTQSWITIVFYVILFIFMMCLELMVLTIKNEECDYDLIVIHQLQKKKLMLNSMLSKYKEEMMMGTEKTEQENAE